MSTNPKKPWETPWTTEEIIENASNWSLAGDVALLKTLENFSDNLLKKTQETDASLNKLLQKLDETSLKLDITKNEFLSLHNRQFVESRVYEEDESVDAESEETKEEQEAQKSKSEEEITAEMKQAVLSGLKMIEKYYYKSELLANNSDYDSDESNSAPLYALTLKDPYIDRPLPYEVGTTEWHKKWHVGLRESSSESENEAASEKFSDTDSETDLPVSNRAPQVKISDTSSEEPPVANSTFARDGDVSSESSGSDLGGSVPVKAPISSVNFAEQLAAKLGSVINQQLPLAEQSEEVNKRPIQKSSVDRFAGGLFSDEPPPLDEDDEGDMFDENTKKGLFSGGQGLFDNDDENVPVIKKEEIVSISQKVSGGLFDDDEEEENDLFATATAAKVEIKKPFLANPTKPTSLPLYIDEPPELDDVDTNSKKSKPVGGVSIFGGANIFENKPSLKKPAAPVESDINKNVEEEKVVEPPKKISLFDDDNLFEDDLFSNITAKKFTSGLFDGDDEVEKSSTKVPVSLFDSNPPPDPDDWDTKSEEEKDIPPYEPAASSTQSNVFNDEPPPLLDEKKSGGLFGSFEGVRDDLFSPLKIPPPKREEEVKEKSQEAKSKLASLFDDDDAGLEDDLFSSIKHTENKTGETKNKLSSLFEDVGVPDEDDIFAGKTLFKSEKRDEALSKGEKGEGSGSNTPKLQSKSEKSIGSETGLFSKVDEEKPLDEDEQYTKKTKMSLFGDDDEADIFSTKDTLPAEKEKKEDVFVGETSKPTNERKSLLFEHDAKLEGELFSDVGALPTKKEDEEKPPIAKEKPKILSDVLETDADTDRKIKTKPPVPKEKPTNEQKNLFGKSEPEIFSDKDKEKDNAAKKQENTTSEPKKLLFEDDGEVDGGLFSSVKKPSLPMGKPSNEPKPESPPTKVETQPETGLFSKEKKKNETPSESNQPKASPGKLKHSLNINVGALMPGAVPPSFLVKSQSLEIKSEEEVREDLPVQSSSEVSLCSGSAEEKPVSFETGEEVVETLKSVTKDRARIPIKRRPSTRRARQEQIRRSVPDFKLDPSPPTTPAPETPIPDSAIFTEMRRTPEDDETASAKKGKSLFTDTATVQPKKTSLFDSPDSDSSDDMFKTEKAKVVTGDLFAKDDGLFGTRKPALKKADTIDIFNDGDDMEDIFSSKKLPPKSDIMKKSLFDDDLDDDEEDIFGAAASKVNVAPTKKAAVVKPQKATIRKLNATEMDDDPLSALQKKD